MRALNIAWKDFRRTYRDIAGLAMMLVAPLLLAAAMGAAFSSGDSFTIAAVKTVVVDQDVAGAVAADDTPAGGVAGAAGEATHAGAHIVAALTSLGLADVLAVTVVETAEQARMAVDQDEADAAVIIPAGLTETLQGGAGAAAAPASGGARVEVYKNPAVTVGPAIVTAVVESVIQALDGARAAVLASVQTGVDRGVVDSAKLADLAAKTAKAYGAAAAGTGAVALEARAPQTPGEEDRPDPNAASQVLVGMMILFMFFGAATPARSILDEHRQGTLFRLFITPTPRSVILSGKYIAVFMVVLIQSVILLLAGWLLLGARWGEFGPVAVLTLTSALVAASLGLLTVSFAKTAGQAGAVSSAIFVSLALIGGNFVGNVNAGSAFALIRRLTPNGWLIEGWEHVLYGGSWATIALPVAAALGFSLVFFALATWFFSRRYA